MLSFYRTTVCEIDLGALAHNLSLLRSRVTPHTRVIAVVKSNAYGHGAPDMARELVRIGVDCLAVVSLEEAIELRSEGIRAPILILGLLFPNTAVPLVEYGFSAAVFTPDMVVALNAAAVRIGRKARLHLKLDTGMNRIGAPPNSLDGLARTIHTCPNVSVEGVFTHLARADSDPEYTAGQVKMFEEGVERLEAQGIAPTIRHVANSAASLLYPEWSFDAIRPGLALYGISPCGRAGHGGPVPGAENSGQDGRLNLRGGGEPRHDLRAVLTLKTRILHVKEVPPDTPISYGGTFRTARTSRIATLPVGYADGLNRHRSSTEKADGRGTVLVRGTRAPIVGRITMDMTMVDVTEVPGVSPNDETVLIGTQGSESITAQDWADEIGTIPYEVVCGISPRIPRVVVRKPTTLP